MSSFFAKITDKKRWKNWFRSKGLYDAMPDREYIVKQFADRMDYQINLDNPKTFNEKIQWLKLYDRKPIYTKMVDKYEAKEYVAKKIGYEYIIPTYGVWNNFKDIDFQSLPHQYVLKCTHDSGGLAIIRNPEETDWKKVKKKIEKSLKTNFYLKTREWPYKDVKPRIIAEKYMEDFQSKSIMDYKFFCFHGVPKFLYVSSGLEDHATARMTFLTIDWKLAGYERSDFTPFSELPQKPKNYEKMLEIASKLSNNMPFLRVDLYEINDKIYFSELTFSPCGGLTPFKRKEYDLEIGDMLVLPK